MTVYLIENIDLRSSDILTEQVTVQVERLISSLKVSRNHSMLRMQWNALDLNIGLLSGHKGFFRPELMAYAPVLP